MVHVRFYETLAQDSQNKIATLYVFLIGELCDFEPSLHPALGNFPIRVDSRLHGSKLAELTHYARHSLVLYQEATEKLT